MATKSDDVPAPPLCNPISPSASADSIQCKHWNNAICCIRDIVSQPPGFQTPSSVTSTVNACAATLSAAEFSDLLQTRNIEGHTALHWAIVNNRPETFSALAGFISQFSSDCSSDLRLACMTTSDHELFTRLNLGGNSNDPKDEPLRRSLGCPADEIQVHGGESTNQFDVCFRIRMFQKRLRTTQDMRCEFIAGGRIWSLRFYMAPIKGIWCAEIGLSHDSLPARPSPDVVLVIEAHKQKHGRPPNALRISLELARKHKSESKPPSLGRAKALHNQYITTSEICNELGDWVMHENSVYVDHEGTLHAKLKIKLSLFAISS